MVILGVGGLLRNGAAALLVDGTLVAAIEEEKLLRQAHPGGLPWQAIDACLAVVGATRQDPDCVALASPVSAGVDPSFHLQLRTLFPKSRIVVVDHHVAHASSAFYLSTFDEARVVTLDRSGDVRSGVVWDARGTRLEPVDELYAPDSPAAFYSRITELLGFRAGAEEHKVQWLSMQGEPRFLELFRAILGTRAGRLPRLDHSYFDMSRPFQGGFSDRFHRALGIESDAPVPASLRADIAASVQRAVEDAVLEIAGEGERLCLAGGLMLNALLVARLEHSGRFKEVFVQPAAGTAGTAAGAALYAWHRVLGQPRSAPLRTLFLGPEYDREHLKRVVENCKLPFHYLNTTREIIDAAVAKLTRNQIVAWFHGPMEFGPRALGNRSIFASPGNPYSTENLNVYIKHRETYRKFAASVPEELASTWFECGSNARYLSTVSRVKPEHRRTFQAALLGGDLIRVHTVRRDDNPLCWELLHAMGRASQLPVLYNTSFNLFGEPLVNDPRAAIRSFYASGIDAMLLGNFLLEK